jgi:preprotein translocase subunit SecA
MECPHLNENYKADITYVTNYEVTFDFLRDNMALNLSDVVLRPLIIASLMKLTLF